MNKKDIKAAPIDYIQFFKIKNTTFWVKYYIMSLVISAIVIWQGMLNGMGDTFYAVIIIILNCLLYPISEAGLQTLMSEDGIFGSLRNQLRPDSFDNIKFSELIVVVVITGIKRAFIKLLIWTLSIFIAPISVFYLSHKVKKNK